MTTKDLHDYTDRFANLNTNRSKKLGTAPHKPILLLAILELIDQNQNPHNQIELTPQLIAAFLKYWSHLVTTAHKPTIALPYYHLSSEPFWHLRPNPHSTSHKINPSIKTLQDRYLYAHLDPELHSLLLQQPNRLILIQTLLKTYFQTNFDDIKPLYSTDAFANQLRALETSNAIYSIEELNQESEEQQILRSGAFRTRVTNAYQQQCALCRLKIISHSGHTIIDGAHIKPFAQFRDDRLSNGLALCA
jgi:putative restriction endonuclease